MSTKYDTIAFSELRTLVKESKIFGMVVMGVSGEAKEWSEGIEDLLRQESIVSSEGDVFARAAKLTGNVLGDEGRTDLVLLFTSESKPDIGKLAMWRLKFGDISWLDDFVVNYSEDYRRVRTV